MAPVNKGNQEAKKKTTKTKTKIEWWPSKICQFAPIVWRRIKKRRKKKEDDDEQDLGWSQGLIVWRGINKSGIPRFPFDPSNQQHEEDAMHEIKLNQRGGGTIGPAHERIVHMPRSSSPPPRLPFGMDLRLSATHHSRCRSMVSPHICCVLRPTFKTRVTSRSSLSDWNWIKLLSERRPGR